MYGPLGTGIYAAWFSSRGRCVRELGTLAGVSPRGVKRSNVTAFEIDWSRWITQQNALSAPGISHPGTPRGGAGSVLCAEKEKGGS